MIQVKRFKFGTGVQAIHIYRKQGDKVSLVDTEYTDKNGVMRWMPPSAGTYSFICDMNPEANIIGYTVAGDTGYADNLMIGSN